MLAESPNKVSSILISSSEDETSTFNYLPRNWFTPNIHRTLDRIRSRVKLISMFRGSFRMFFRNPRGALFVLFTHAYSSYSPPFLQRSKRGILKKCLYLPFRYPSSDHYTQANVELWLILERQRKTITLQEHLTGQAMDISLQFSSRKWKTFSTILRMTVIQLFL